MRVQLATEALKAAGVADAVIGGPAIAWWVAEVDEAAVRCTPAVDFLSRCADRLQELLDDPDG